MNFKFPSSLENPPPNPPFNPNPNPNSSYFTPQAIQGYVTNDVSRREVGGFPATGDVTRREYDGYTAAGDVGRRHYDGYAAAGDVPWREFDYSRNAVSLRQREIEKDRIRAEIIAEEMRRRSLEEEVRREMIRDRELGFRYDKSGFGVGGSGSMMANFEYRGGGGASSYRDVEYGGGFHAMPLSRDRVVGGGRGRGSGVTLREIKEDKAVVLAKPRSNLADLKRKTMMPPVGGAMDVYKKPKDGWSCALCQITTTSEQGLKDHLRGKKHQARESGTLPHMTGFGTVPLPKMLSASTVKPLTLLKKPSNSSLKDEGKMSVGSSLTNVGNSTTRKTNHIPLKVKRTSLVKKGNITGKAPATRGKGKTKFQYFCEMCRIGANSTIVFDAHMKGKKHLANLSLFNKTDETTYAEASVQKALTDEKKGEAKTPVIGEVGKPHKKFRYFCKLCQVGANSMIVFDTHKKGKRHAANLSLLNKTDEPAQVEVSADLAQKAVTEENKELAAVETLMMGEPEETSGEQLAAVETVMMEEPEEITGEQLAAIETLSTGEPEETSEGEPEETSEGEPEETSEEEPEETSEGEPKETSEGEPEETSEEEPEETSEGEPEETSEENKDADVSRPEDGDKLLEIGGEGTLASKMTNQVPASSEIAS